MSLPLLLKTGLEENGIPLLLRLSKLKIVVSERCTFFYLLDASLSRSSSGIDNEVWSVDEVVKRATFRDPVGCGS